MIIRPSFCEDILVEQLATGRADWTSILLWYYTSRDIVSALPLLYLSEGKYMMVKYVALKDNIPTQARIINRWRFTIPPPGYQK